MNVQNLGEKRRLIGGKHAQKMCILDLWLLNASKCSAQILSRKLLHKKAEICKRLRK